MPTPTQVSAPAPTITAPCTPETCPIDWALIRYFPNLAGNTLYLALFALMLLAQVYQGLRFRTWSYLGCMACGTLLEVIGYGGRLILHNNPFNFSAFLQYFSTPTCPYLPSRLALYKTAPGETDLETT
jgi:hypothetical protein